MDDVVVFALTFAGAFFAGAMTQLMASMFRGRMEAKDRERWMQLMMTGQPPGFKARGHRATEPEDRIAEAEQMIKAPDWDKATVKRGMAQLREFYQDQRLQVPSEADLRKEAQQLLNESVQGGLGASE